MGNFVHFWPIRGPADVRELQGLPGRAEVPWREEKNNCRNEEVFPPIQGPRSSRTFWSPRPSRRASVSDLSPISTLGNEHPPAEYYFIGLTDQAQEGTYTWLSDGTELQAEDFWGKVRVIMGCGIHLIFGPRPKLHFRLQRLSRPRIYGGRRQNCVVMWPTGVSRSHICTFINARQKWKPSTAEESSKRHE